MRGSIFFAAFAAIAFRKLVMSTPSNNLCPVCGTSLVNQGDCPHCLMMAAMQPTDAGAESWSEAPPDIEAVRAAFPQLEIIELIGGAHEGALAYDTLFVETVGAGQNETRIRKFVDTTAVVLTPGMGDAVQMDKAGILEIADVFVCNKADHPGEHELVRDLKDVAGRRTIVETVATRSQGIEELLGALLG